MRHRINGAEFDRPASQPASNYANGPTVQTNCSAEANNNNSKCDKTIHTSEPRAQATAAIGTQGLRDSVISGIFVQVESPSVVLNRRCSGHVVGNINCGRCDLVVRFHERDGIMSTVGGLACKCDELMAKKKEEGREFVKDKRVVYIYHDIVDAVGDDAKTEGHTFEAVRRAIDELAALVNFIVNNLNANHVIITADHGFLFTETARVETDKSQLTEKPGSTILAKKRYLLGPKLPDNASAWHGKVSETAGAEGNMEFWIPKGANVFHFVGGARFVHGGAMPQEIVVPVITVKHKKEKSSRGDTKVRPVTVQILGTNHRITSAFHRFQLIQMEPVAERIRAVTLKVAIFDGDEPVTDVQSVKFESASGNLDERKKWISLVLKDRQYSKKTPYRLVLRDAETGIEHQSAEVIIDRSFTEDF